VVLTRSKWTTDLEVGGDTNPIQVGLLIFEVLVFVSRVVALYQGFTSSCLFAGA
jgi:hypothetical protein